jgi:hypothetical protein
MFGRIGLVLRQPTSQLIGLGLGIELSVGY